MSPQYLWSRVERFLPALVLSLICAWPASAALATQAPYRLAVLVSIDGLHEADVRDPRLAAEFPNLQRLARSGVGYENARTSAPSDSLPGTLAYLTGSRPATTGIYYDDTFDRTLTPPGGGPSSHSSVVDLTAAIDRDAARLDGGGDAGVGSIDPSKLAQRCGQRGCVPLWPHSYLLANTLFDVLGAHRMRSVLIEKHPAYVVAFAHRAPYVTFYAPEIDAGVALEGGRLVDRSTAHRTGLDLRPVGSNEATAEAYDDLKMQVALRELAGHGLGRPGPSAVPALVVLNLQAVNFAEKAANGGIDGEGHPSTRLREALRYDDRAVGRIVDLLVERGMTQRTLLVVFAKHGESPRIGRARLAARSAILAPLRRAGIAVAHMTSDDVALVWLQHPADANQAARILAPLGRIISGPRALRALASRPSRTPDLVLLPPAGTIYVSNPAKATKRAEHGGFSPDDRDVPLIVWSSRIASTAPGRWISSPVSTRQIAPTVLAALGLDPRELSGVRAEGTMPLPGVPLP